MVPSAEPVSLEELEGRVAKLAESADALIVEVRRAIPALTGDARTLLGNLNQITGEQNQKRIEQTLANLNTLLERESPKIAQLTDQISELAKHADSVVGSVEPVLSHVDHAVVNVDNTVVAIREPLSKDLTELGNTLQAAHTVLADIHNVVGSNQPLLVQPQPADLAGGLPRLPRAAQQVRLTWEPSAMVAVREMPVAGSWSGSRPRPRRSSAGRVAIANETRWWPDARSRTDRPRPSVRGALIVTAQVSPADMNPHRQAFRPGRFPWRRYRAGTR